jgi:hypothetical protein
MVFGGGLDPGPLFVEVDAGPLEDLAAVGLGAVNHQGDVCEGVAEPFVEHEHRALGRGQALEEVREGE